MITVISVLPLIAGVFAFMKYKLQPITFYIMFIVSVCGLGFYYNDIMRMGAIFPSDIYLALFFVFFILFNRGILPFSKSDTAIVVLVSLLQLIFGMISGYELGEILADFKLILYFFIPYFYGKSIIGDEEKNKGCFVAYCACVGISLVLNWINFLNTGLININSGGNQIIRTFGIGLGFACGVIVECLLIEFRDVFISKFGNVLYYIIHVVLIVSTSLSFTRTSWIVYATTIALYFILVHSKTNIDHNTLARGIVRVIFAILIVFMLMGIAEKHFPEITDSIQYRVNSIFEKDDTGDNADTLTTRFNDVLTGSDVFFSPRILVGYGYGALYKASNGYYYAQIENSYIYYLWKYGIIMGMYLFARLLMHIFGMWKSDSRATKTMAICIVMQMAVSSLSGNMNRPYTLGVVAILLAMDYAAIENSILNRNDY